MPHKRILILGGTNDARVLASKLVLLGHDVTTSFAGVTEHPLLPEGKIRRGGFGGVAGLRDYLRAEKIDVVVDATHPFAAIISRHAAEASSQVLRLERTAWTAQTGDQWINVPDMAAAVEALPFEARVLLTIGRKEIGAFISRPDLSGVARMIEPPELSLPAQWTLLLARPPFSLESEIALMQRERITHLVSKNAGGGETIEKLQVARALMLPVIMIARPAKPAVKTYETAEALIQDLQS
jgi:precorrin-6A/cobalt-precorrin-6A reductase